MRAAGSGLVRLCITLGRICGVRTLACRVATLRDARSRGQRLLVAARLLFGAGLHPAAGLQPAQNSRRLPTSHAKLARYRAALLLVLPALLCAQSPRELSIVTGRGELLQFERDIERVAISEPKIADAIVVSPREIMVNAKTPGKASLVVWEVAASAPARFNINILADTSEVEISRKELQAGLPEGVQVGGSGDTIVLSGTVKDATEIKRIEGMASARGRTVVNLLQTPPAPDPRQILLQVKFASIDRVALSELGFNLFSVNQKGVGATTTQQFQNPRFSQLQFQNGEFTTPSVNFADLLNLFVFRPDLNIGATIRAGRG